MNIVFDIYLKRPQNCQNPPFLKTIRRVLAVLGPFKVNVAAWGRRRRGLLGW